MGLSSNEFFTAQKFVVGHGEAMRFVSDALQEVNGGRRVRQDERREFAWSKHFFVPFGQSQNGDGQTEFSPDLHGCRELWPSTIDEYEVRR